MGFNSGFKGLMLDAPYSNETCGITMQLWRRFCPFFAVRQYGEFRN